MKELCCIYILLLLVNLLPYNEDKIKELYKVIQSSKGGTKMSSLLNIIEKFQYREDFFLNTEDLPEKLINKLLKWYDGNPYNKSDKRIKDAFHILSWCYDKSDIDYLPRDMRAKRFEAAAQALNISHEKLVKLLILIQKFCSLVQKKQR